MDKKSKKLSYCKITFSPKLIRRGLVDTDSFPNVIAKNVLNKLVADSDTDVKNLPEMS